MLARPRGFVQVVAAIAVGGAALRALVLFTVARHTVGIGDWWFYHWQAGLIAGGRGFLDPFQLLQHHAVPSAGHPPLYPLVLAGLTKIGLGGTLGHRSLGLVLGPVTIVLVALIARRVAGERAGIAAAAIAAVYPIFIGVDTDLMSEVVYGPLVAGSVLAALYLVDRPRVRTCALLGALIGLAALTRTEAVLIVPLLGLPLAWRGGGGRARVARLAAVVGACALVLAPWTIRNATTFGRFVPISTNDATVAAGANCHLTYHGTDMGGWNIQCISQRTSSEDSVQAAKWRSEGIHYATHHLGRLPVVATVRFLRVWDFWQPRRQVQFAEGRQHRVEQAGVAMYWLLLPLALMGLLSIRTRFVHWILIAPFVMVSITAVTGYGVPRLRHAAEIPLVALAGVGLNAVLDRRAARRAARPRAVPA